MRNSDTVCLCRRFSYIASSANKTAKKRLMMEIIECLEGCFESHVFSEMQKGNYFRWVKEIMRHHPNTHTHSVILAKDFPCQRLVSGTHNHHHCAREIENWKKLHTLHFRWPFCLSMYIHPFYRLTLFYVKNSKYISKLSNSKIPDLWRDLWFCVLFSKFTKFSCFFRCEMDGD